MMHPALTKQRLYDRQLILHPGQFRLSDFALTLRIVDIIRDLRVFYDWMEDPRLLANWQPGEKNRRLNRHYRLFLNSENRQSFLVEKSKQPHIQFDIFEMYLHELYCRVPTAAGDCILNYFIPNKENIIGDLKAAISLQLDYFFSFNGCSRLWLPVPETQFVLFDIIRATGFKYKTSYVSKRQRHMLFFLKRAGYFSQKNQHLNNSDTD
jgi:hypothetical protein